MKHLSTDTETQEAGQARLGSKIFLGVLRVAVSPW